MPPNTRPLNVHMVCPRCEETIDHLDFRQHISRTGYGTVQLENMYVDEGNRQYYRRTGPQELFNVNVADLEIDDESDSDYGDADFQCPECCDDIEESEIYDAIRYDSIREVPPPTPPRRTSPLQSNDTALHIGGRPDVVVSPDGRTTIPHQEEGSSQVYSLAARMLEQLVQQEPQIQTCSTCNKDLLITKEETICTHCGAELTTP